VRAAISILLALACASALAQEGMPRSLTGAQGDAARGRAIVAGREGLCLFCHRAPIPEDAFQGDLAPDLAGVGGRLDEAQLRLRLVDPRRINPATIMPSYYRTEGRVRVAPEYAGRPLLSAAQIEDVIAYLRTLR
jgi:sulfur-oxidizing protein SoxX